MYNMMDTMQRTINQSIDIHGSSYIIFGISLPGDYFGKNQPRSVSYFNESPMIASASY